MVLVNNVLPRRYQRRNAISPAFHTFKSKGPPLLVSNICSCWDLPCQYQTCAVVGTFRVNIRHAQLLEAALILFETAYAAVTTFMRSRENTASAERGHLADSPYRGVWSPASCAHRPVQHALLVHKLEVTRIWDNHLHRNDSVSRGRVDWKSGSAA